VEQRIVIKFLVGENVPSAEIHQTPTTVWGRVSPTETLFPNLTCLPYKVAYMVCTFIISLIEHLPESRTLRTKVSGNAIINTILVSSSLNEQNVIFNTAAD